MAHKLIYLARRNPGIAASAFGEAWRSHSRLASTLGPDFARHFTRVRQCIKVHEAMVPAAFTNTFDGAAILTMKSWDDLRAARSHPDAVTTMRIDELRVFAGHVADWTMAVEEVFAAGDPHGNAALLWFARRSTSAGRGRKDADLESLQIAWHACGSNLAAAARTAGANGVALDRVLESPGPQVDFTGIAELWFDTVEAARAAAWQQYPEGLRELDGGIDPTTSVSMLVGLNFEKRPTA